MTLKQRIEELTVDRPRGWQADLARACGIKPPSVSDWVTGKTTKIDADYLFEAADFFKVNPKWLATGRGPKMRAMRDWPFPDIDKARFDRLTPEQQTEIQGGVRRMIQEFENRAPSSGEPHGPSFRRDGTNG